MGYNAGGSGGGGSAAFVGVKVRKKADVSIASNTGSVVSWGPADVEDWDTDGFHDPAVNPTRLTIPAGKGGKYLVNVRIGWVANATGYRLLQVLKNAASTPMIDSRIGANALVDGQNTTGILNLVAGDYIEIQVRHLAGAALSYTGGSGVNEDVNSGSYCELTRLGA